MEAPRHRVRLPRGSPPSLLRRAYGSSLPPTCPGSGSAACRMRGTEGRTPSCDHMVSRTLFLHLSRTGRRLSDRAPPEQKSYKAMHAQIGVRAAAPEEGAGTWSAQTAWVPFLPVTNRRSWGPGRRISTSAGSFSLFRPSQPGRPKTDFPKRTGVELHRLLGNRPHFLEREGAARAIFGDLFLVEALLQEMLTRREWSSHLYPNRPLDTWRDFSVIIARSHAALVHAASASPLKRRRRQGSPCRSHRPLTTPQSQSSFEFPTTPGSGGTK